MAELNGAADPGGASPPPAPAPAPASNGADHGATYTVTDARSAGDAIAGLLFADDTPTPPPTPGGDKPSGEPSVEEPPDPGADESQPTGDDDKGPGEQPPPAAAIEPPASWSSDEKQAFSELPPALQQTVARRESQREAVLTQRSQEAAEARRAYDGERQAAVAQRAEYLAGLQKMLHLAAPEAEALNNVDWMAVAQNPAEYTRLQAMRESLKSRLGAIEQQFQQSQQQLQQYQLQQLAEVVAKEHQQLNSKMPDFGDPVKGNQLRKDLGSYLQDHGGFTAQEINAAYDHRLVMLAIKAMRYDQQLAAAASADTKRNNIAAPVRPPGSSQDNDRGPQSRLARQVQRLGRTNSVRDAGSLIAEIL
jgi:hypothetical protein